MKKLVSVDCGRARAALAAMAVVTAAHAAGQAGRVSQSDSRLKGLEALEIFLVTVPKEFADNPNVPSATDLRALVEHRLAADKVPTVSFYAVSDDPAKLQVYQGKKKGHLIVDVQLLRSGEAYAYNVVVQVVEDAKVVRTGASILTPVWSKAAIGASPALHLKAALRNQIVDLVDALAGIFARANGG